MSQAGSLARIALAGVALAAPGYAVWRPQPEAMVAAPAPVPVEIATAEMREVPVHLTNLGTVESFNTVTIRSRVDGELQQVLFHEGHDIRQGDLLAVIDPRTFQAALDQDYADLANASLILGRDTQLGQRDFLPAQTVGNQRSRVAELDAQIEQDKAMMCSAETQLSYTRVTSPIDGRTGLRLVDLGKIVHADDQTGLVVINQIHPTTAISAIPERDVPAISAALATGTVEAQALSREDGSAGLGALVTLRASHFDLPIIASIGVILRIGIVKKNGIMIVDFALERERLGLSPRDAIHEACLPRFRPILMTTMAALLAGVPLMLGHGTGSELRQPLGNAIVGGLLVSQLLTLHTTPVIYLYLDRLNRRRAAATPSPGMAESAR